MFDLLVYTMEIQIFNHFQGRYALCSASYKEGTIRVSLHTPLLYNIPQLTLPYTLIYPGSFKPRFQCLYCH